MVILLDATKDHQKYKQGLHHVIETEADDGDTICLVGFGRVVSKVNALRAGVGRVIAFEGSQEMIRRGRETLQMLGIGERVDIHHATLEKRLTCTEMGPSQLSSRRRISRIVMYW